jgi:hypothetical protein
MAVRAVTITTDLDEAPLLSVWFATEDGTTLSRLCVGDQVNVTARPSDPDGVASVMGAVFWIVGNQDGGTPLHEMRYDAPSQTYLLGTIGISRSAQWVFT